MKRYFSTSWWLKWFRDWNFLKKQNVLGFFQPKTLTILHPICKTTGFPVSLPTRVGLCDVPVEFAIRLCDWRGTIKEWQDALLHLSNLWPVLCRRHALLELCVRFAGMYYIVLYFINRMPNILTFIVEQNSNKWTPPKQKAHISYPVQVLGKSCKPVAVMAVCLLLRQKSYALQKYLCVLTIVAGVVVFLYNPKKAGNADGVTIGTGELWILASLTLGKIISLNIFYLIQFQTDVSPHARSTWNATSNRPSRIWCSIWIWFHLSSSPPKASGVGPFSVSFNGV